VTLVTGNGLLKWQSFLWRFRRTPFVIGAEKLNLKDRKQAG